MSTWLKILILLGVLLGIILFPRTKIVDSVKAEGVSQEVNVQLTTNLYKSVVIGDNTLSAIVPMTNFPISKEVYAIIDCESNWRMYDSEGNLLEGDRDKKHSTWGLSQTQLRTWKWLSELSGMEWNINNEQHHIELLTWSLESGYGYLWSCAK